jgi:hypothetical protein
MLNVSVPVAASTRPIETVSDPAFTAYLQKHGMDWEDWFGGALYARIDAEKMFTFHSSSPPET